MRRNSQRRPNVAPITPIMASPRIVPRCDTGIPKEGSEKTTVACSASKATTANQ